MATIPEHFKACHIEVEVISWGTIGIVIGLLYHYPHWVGILEPTSTFKDRQEELCDKLERDELITIQLRDLVNGEAWLGKVSFLTLPRSGYPWYELEWRDDKRPPGISMWEKMMRGAKLLKAIFK